MIGAIFKKDDHEYKLVSVEPWAKASFSTEQGFIFHFHSEARAPCWTERFLGILVILNVHLPHQSGGLPNDAQQVAFEKVKEAFEAEFEGVSGMTKIAGGYSIKA